MNLKKYKRFFAFGCSFTYYNWMTWADIIGSEITEYYNYGKPGSGNGYIFASIVEANIRHKFNEDDLVIVMWSGIDREDRYINGSWKAAGCVYHSIDNFYDNQFNKKYSDDRGYLIRDMNYICAIDKLLDNIPHHFLSMMPLTKVTEFDDKTGDSDVYEYYKEILSKVKPSIFEVIYNNDWNNRQKVKKKMGMFKYETDFHPTPKLHLEYLEKSFPDLEISTDTINLVNIQEDSIFEKDYFDPNEFPYFVRRYIYRL